MRLRKTAQAHETTADLVLDAVEMAREAKASHGLDDGVEKAAKAEEDEVEIVFLKQQALGAARTGLRLGGAGLNLGKTSPEPVKNHVAVKIPLDGYQVFVRLRVSQ